MRMGILLLGYVVVGTLFCGSLSSTAEIIKRMNAPVSGEWPMFGMYANSENEVWFANEASIVDQFGRKVEGIPEVARLMGISKHPTENVYAFCDLRKDQVSLVTPGSSRTIVYSIIDPLVARWSPSGKWLYVMTTWGVVRFSSEGQKEEVAPYSYDLLDIAPVSDDGFWLSSNPSGVGKVCYYDARTRFEKSIQPKVCHDQSYYMMTPRGLWPREDGSVMAVDSYHGRLVQIKQDGKVTIRETGLRGAWTLQFLNEDHYVVFRPGDQREVIFGRLDN